ncbi:apical endosomal glycoprotein [Diretmus argenteus]
MSPLQSSSAGHPCWAPEHICDFDCDCTDCSDETNCGYTGKEQVCDFENSAVCGWKDQSLDPAYAWMRRQRGDTLPDSGPSSDYTTGTAIGWFMGVSAVMRDSPATAILISPKMNQSSPTCRLRLRYFLWDSGHMGFGSTPLWASLLQEGSREAIVWRPESTSVRGWREATMFLGRIATTFQIRLYSRRSKGQAGDVAIDHLEFLDCALPSPDRGTACSAGTWKCKHEGCVEMRQVCDGTDDCGDRTDEENCGLYQHCDFDKDLCFWDLRSLSDLKWVRTSQTEISTTDPQKGPGRDHSTNSASGHFLYVTVPPGGSRMDWAAFQSPLLEPTNTSHPCKMVMYTHQFGPRSGGLTVLVAGQSIYPVWERGGALGDLWVKAEVEIVTDVTFYIVVMAAIRDFAYGGIAVDSITLSPECRLSEGNYSLESFPNPPEHPCTEPNKMCDFRSDCPGAEDEAKCGDFSYAQGSSGWTDRSVGNQGWMLNEQFNSTTDEYLYVAETPGQQKTEAQTRTPLLGPSGLACTLSFSFALTGNADHIGEVSVSAIDSFQSRKLWEFSGKTGTEESAWQKANVSIGARKHRFQLEFGAYAKTLSPGTMIKVKDVRFLDCHAAYFPFSDTALSCNFEDGLCGWYQDMDDNFDWTVLSGMDHSIGIGNSLVVDMWDPSLRGSVGRFLSYPQLPITTDNCLSFFYKLYGPDTGALNVKLQASLGFETLLWTRSGAHGNMWHEGHCSVPHQLTNFQLMFEAVRSGFDGQIAIDDLAFTARPCALPRMCSFESQRCGYSSSGAIRWLHGNGLTTQTGPKTDHTLETKLGYYMVANTDVTVLPLGSATSLTSPIRQGVAQTTCVHFWYHMEGENPGSLTVYMKPVKGERVKVFSNNLNQGDSWRHGNGNITSTLVDWQLEFEVVGAGGRDTHVAVDDVVLLAHPCQNQGSKCNLERGMCGWSNTQNRNLDKLDWELTSPLAETHYTTPPRDHTLGTDRGHFIFFPSSSRTPANQHAHLLSAHLPPTKGTCLKFWVHRPASADNQLNVLKLTGDKLEQLLVVTEVGGMWKRFNVNIVSIYDYQIVLEGTKGTAGLLALDDIEYTIGVNCAGEITDQLKAESKPDNAGGIAASVIVLLLLLATLTALMYYYLRFREKVKASAAAQSTPSLPRGFGNASYEPDLTQDRVMVPPVQNHPMEAGFNNVVTSDVEAIIEKEVA